MKPRHILLSLLAGFSVLSLNVYAAPEADMAAMNEPGSNMQADQAATRKKHSHVEEKTGVPQKVVAAAAGKTQSIPNPDKHYHPRDGK